MHTTNIQFRVDAKLKSQAEKILEDMGFDISTLLKATLKRVVKLKDFPFPIGVGADVDENGLTKKQQKQLDAALKELENPKSKRKSFSSMQEAIDFLK